MTEKIKISAKNEDQALKMASEQVRVEKDLLNIKLVSEGKKGFFGKFKKLPEFEVSYKKINNEKASSDKSLEDEEIEYYSIEEIPDDDIKQKVDIALDYLDDILNSFDIGPFEKNVQIDSKNNLTINLNGENASAIIGKFGDVLYSIQYLVTLSSNQNGGKYMNISLDIGDFKNKRENTLKELGNRIAKKAINKGRSIALNPMNPYERRIIHSVITETDGVYSKSVGKDPYRKVVVFPNKRKYGSYRQSAKKGKKDNGHVSNKNLSNKPSTYNFEKEFLKSNSDESKNYGKIDLKWKLSVLKNHQVPCLFGGGWIVEWFWWSHRNKAYQMLIKKRGQQTLNGF